MRDVEVVRRSVRVRRQIREWAATLVVFVVLFGLLMAISPSVRDRVSNLEMGGAQGHNVNSSLGPATSAASSILSIGTEYARENPILFSFLVVAVVLFRLMLSGPL